MTVSTTGGVIGDRRVLSVDGRELQVTEHGEVRAHRRLAPAHADHLRGLAAEVADLEFAAPAPPKAAVYGGTTTIEIAGDGGDDVTADRCIVLSAGDDAPEPVWMLLDTVEALSRPDGSPDPA